MAVAGAAGLTFIGYLNVRGDLSLQGEGFVPGYTRVARHAFFGSNFTGLGPLTVLGDVHHAGDLVAVPPLVSGAITREPVNVRPPCPCGPGEVLDVAALVDGAARANDNALLGIQEGALRQVVGSKHLQLPCGRYYFSEVSGLGDIQVDVLERVAIFVEGDVAAAGNMEFRVGPRAELDLFIKGNLGSIGRASFGTTERPAATRIYVAGRNQITLIGAGASWATFTRRTPPWTPSASPTYGAPSSPATSAARATPGSSLTAPSSGPARTVTRTIPPQRYCNECHGCRNGQACISGFCEDCTQDDDCCSNEICEAGRCRVLEL